MLKVRTTLSEYQELKGDKLTATELETALLSTNLFSLVHLYIENLFSRPRSKDKDNCLKLLFDYTGDKTILCWEKKSLTKAALAKLPKSWKISESKPPALLFSWLESLTPGNYPRSSQLLRSLRTSTDETLIFIMLSRHLGNLIQAKSATAPKLPPWQLGKLRAQASAWSETQLIQFLDSLYTLDYQIKTGRTKLDLSSQLDIVLYQVLG